MNNRQRMRIALDYLETKLDEKISLEEVAGKVNFSEYHFHRLFQKITGYTLMSYVRQRRLYLAGQDILRNNESLAQIAQKYHFSSQSSFSVAFKHLYKVSPGAFKESKDLVPPIGPLVLSKTLDKRPIGLLTEPSMVMSGGFYVYGKKCQVNSKELESVDNPIDKLWKQSHINQRDLIAVYVYDPLDIYKEEIDFLYYLGRKKQGQEDDSIWIPESTYLKFTVDKSLTSLYQVYDYIDGSWLLNSDYSLCHAVDFEIHYEKDYSKYADIYISAKEI